MYPMACVGDFMELGRWEVLQDHIMVFLFDVSALASGNEIYSLEKYLLEIQRTNDFVVRIFNGLQVALCGVSTPRDGLDIFE